MQFQILLSVCMKPSNHFPKLHENKRNTWSTKYIVRCITFRQKMSLREDTLNYSFKTIHHKLLLVNSFLPVTKLVLIALQYSSIVCSIMTLYNAFKMWFDTVYTMLICKCLDDHNSGHLNPIKPRFISNVTRNAQLGIHALVRDELIGKLKMLSVDHHITIFYIS